MTNTRGLIAITGASSGIGAALARSFSADGHPLLLMARRLERLEELELPDAICAMVDVVDFEAVQAAVSQAEERFGPLDAMINNAGVMKLSPLEQQDPAEWAQMLDVNVLGVLHGRNVRISIVAPGAVETELLGHTTSTDVIAGYEAWKRSIGGALDAEAVVKAVRYIYDQPQSVCVREVVIANTLQVD